MTETTSPRRRLRQLLSGDDIVVAPGAYDCVTAMLVEQAGFPAVYMTGAGTAASLGYPDYGLVTMSEMADNAGRLAVAVGVPVIADADTGYGNELNVTRTIREYERRGVAALHIEDQGFPKKCGHLDDKEIIPLDDYLAKVRAAVAARTDPDLVIIARTDSRAGACLEEAVRRSNAALAAGADMAFLEAPQTMEELESVPKLIDGPCLLNLVAGGKTPLLDMDAARAMGFKLAIVPGMLLQSAIAAFETSLRAFKSLNGHPELEQGLNLREVFNRFGASDWDALRGRFTGRDDSGPRLPSAAE